MLFIRVSLLVAAGWNPSWTSVLIWKEGRRGAPCGAAVISLGSGLQEADPESSCTGGKGRERLAETGGEPGGRPATLS